MKKKICLIFLIIVALLSVFVACKNKTYAIKYYDEDNVIREIQTPKGLSISDFIPPEKIGFAFMGWYTDKSLKNELPLDFKVDKNISLYAKFEPISSTVTFKIDGYDDIILIATYGILLPNIPTIPNKEGHTAKWDRENFCDIHSNTIITAIYSPITLAITFKIVGYDDIIKYTLYGNELTDIPNIPPIEGKTARWDRNNFTNIIDSFVVEAIYEDIYLSIQFISQHPRDSRLCNIEAKEVKYGDDLVWTERPQQPHPFEGYTGIWENKNFHNIVEDIIVNAHYTPKPLNIRFELENQTVSIIIPYDSIPYEFIRDKTYIELGLESNSIRNTILSPPLPNALIDDNKLRNVRYGSVDSDIFSPIKRETTMYIIWDIFVTFNNGGGDFDDEIYNDGIMVTYNSSINQPVFKNRYGYKFIGWYSDKTYLDEFFFYQSLTEDTALYAKWEQILCSVAFPDIDGITIETDYIQPIPMGENLSFIIHHNEENPIEVWANDCLLNNQNNNYNINIVEEDINIAIKTDNSHIFTLEFYSNKDKTELLYTRKVSQGNKLVIVPQAEEKYLADAYWQYGNENFNFEEENISKDMQFTLTYVYRYYLLRYIISDEKYKESTVTYGDTDFIFYSPKQEERPDNMLFEGWYLDETFETRATKEYVINKGDYIFLYSKWIPMKNIESNLIGLWYDELFLLELFENGTAIVYNHEDIMQSSFSISNNNIKIMGEFAFFDGENIAFLGRNLKKTENDKCFVYSYLTGLFMIDNFTIVNNNLMMGYYWYLDNNLTVSVDITQSLDPALFTNRKLTLFHSPYRYININYDAMGGVTEGNRTTQKITVSDMYEFNPLIPTYEGYIFRGWQLKNTDILLTWNILYFSNQSTIDVQALYIENNYFVGDIIEGTYITSDNELVYILEFSLEGYPYYTITILDTLNHTYTTSIPFLYYWDDMQGFIDENNNLILITDNIITISYHGKLLTMQSNLIPTENGDYYKYELEQDGEHSVNLICFISENNTMFINGKPYNVYYYNNCFYYFYKENNLWLFNYILIEDLIKINRELPEEHLGSYQGSIMLDEDTEFKLWLEIISVDECILNYQIGENLTAQKLVKLVNLNDNKYFVLDNQNIMLFFAINVSDSEYYYSAIIGSIEIELLKDIED